MTCLPRIHGRLVVDNDPAIIDRLWNPMIAAWYEGGKPDPNLALLRFDAEKAEIWLKETSLRWTACGCSSAPSRSRICEGQWSRRCRWSEDWVGKCMGLGKAQADVRRVRRAGPRAAALAGVARFVQ